VRTQSGAAPLTLTGGSIQGSIGARDGEVKTLRDSLNTLAAGLITTVNSVHAAGYNLNGAAGNNFFTGTNAGDINVNGLLLNNPALVQASGNTTAVGDNTTMLALSQLANQPQAGLSNQTFSQSYGQTVATLGQALSSVNYQQADQQVVQNLLQKQRDSYSGVSLDEEMTNLIKYQKAFEASARLINTIDEMLNTVLSLKQ
jgi:flagellar hook-associated protein 1